MVIDPKSKIRSVTELEKLIAGARDAGRRVVFGNGCFDLIHVGHIRYLQGARALGDLLVVGINSDASVRALKGTGRPLQPQGERAEIIGSLECVDYLVLFDAPTVEELLLALKPDIHAKGTDYTSESVPEHDIVRSYGGKVAIVGDPKAHSSRDLIGTILAKMSR
ncbi:MAG: adenylyltransferase/cytidyltransferase family protein [Acidobacteriia bacterium]|nr:adenylyltransferase/cytidyltransferase family protein [Terriglobia bacterium]